MAPPNLWGRGAGGLEKVFQPLPRKNEFWQTTCSLCLGLSTLAIHAPPSCHPRTYWYSTPFLRETTLKFFPVTTCSSKSSFSGSCSVFSIRSRYGYPLPRIQNIEWWCINRITTVTREREGWKIVSHWSIGNLLDGNCDNFLPWQWRKSFGQILVLLSGRDFLILCLFILPLEGPLVHYLPWPSLNWATTNSFCLSASHFKVPT